MASRVLADRAVRPSGAAAASEDESTSTGWVPPFTRAQCTEGAHAVQDPRSRYPACNAAPGRFVRTRAPGIRTVLPRRDAGSYCGQGLERRHPRRERGRCGSGALAVAAAPRVAGRRRRGALLRSHRRSVGRTLVCRTAPHRRSRRNAGRRRLAGGRRHAVLPGHARRSVRARPPAPVRVHARAT